METELYTVRITFDPTVDNVPRQRTYHVVTAKGPAAALEAALGRVAGRVTEEPERKVTEAAVDKAPSDNFVLRDIHDGR